MILMYFLAPMQSIHLNGIMGRVKGSLQDQRGPDSEISARHELVLGATHLKKSHKGSDLQGTKSTAAAEERNHERHLVPRGLDLTNWWKLGHASNMVR